MAESALAKKLQMKPGQTVLVLNPPQGYLAALGPLPEGARLVETDGGADEGRHGFVQLFVRNTAELKALFPRAHRGLEPGGVLWLCYPKKSSGVDTDLTRDVGWTPLAEAGLRPVRQVAIDEVWSALRFRPGDQVAARDR